MKLDVILRKGRDGVLFALLPQLPSDIDGNMCKFFSLQDGFKPCDYKKMIKLTISVKKEECVELCNRLIDMGYCINVVEKTTSNHLKDRKEYIKNGWSIS